MDVIRVPNLLVELLADRVKDLHTLAVDDTPGIDAAESLWQVASAVDRAGHYPETHALYLAVEGGELVGYALVQDRPAREVLGADVTLDEAITASWPSEGVFVTWLAVAPAYRRRGVASALLCAAAQNRPAYALVAEVNNVSRCFWRRLGAEVLGTYGKQFVVGVNLASTPDQV